MSRECKMDDKTSVLVDSDKSARALEYISRARRESFPCETKENLSILGLFRILIAIHGLSMIDVSRMMYPSDEAR